MNTKDFEDLTIANSFLFYNVMWEPKNCKPLLEALLNEEITKITPKPGDGLLGLYASVATRGDIFDLSLRLVGDEALPWHAWTSWAAMNSTALQAGCTKDRLPNTHVILICPNNTFGQGQAECWSCKRTSPLDTGREDSTPSLILNKTFTDDNAPQIVQDFLSWINACWTGAEFDVSGSAYLTQLEEAVRKIKNDLLMERAYRGK